MAVGCGFAACKYMIDRTISLNEAFFLRVVDLYMYVFILIVTFIHYFTHLFIFPVVISKSNITISLTNALIHCLNKN